MHPSGVYLFKMYIHRPHDTKIMIITSLKKAKGAQTLLFLLVNLFSLAPSLCPHAHVISYLWSECS